MNLRLGSCSLFRVVQLWSQQPAQEKHLKSLKTTQTPRFHSTPPPFPGAGAQESVYSKSTSAGVGELMYLEITCCRIVFFQTS